MEVKGEVLNPDVYVLKKGSTIKELIDKAGGVKEDVDTYTINMTKVLNDGDVVVMYKLRLFYFSSNAFLSFNRSEAFPTSASNLPASAFQDAVVSS